jgi:hypothetical protein
MYPLSHAATPNLTLASPAPRPREWLCGKCSYWIKSSSKPSTWPLPWRHGLAAQALVAGLARTGWWNDWGTDGHRPPGGGVNPWQVTV